jgi:hypothetical protein
MSLQRLMVCTMVGLSSVSIAAYAAGPKSSPLKPPVTARHHAAYKTTVRNDKQAKKHFWNGK